MARQRRLREVAVQHAAIEQQLDALRVQLEQHAMHQCRAADEWRAAPTDDALRAFYVAASGLEKQRRAAAARLVQADARLAAARQRWRGAQQQLSDAAADLALPPEMAGLLRVETALGQFERALQALLLEA